MPTYLLFNTNLSFIQYQLIFQIIQQYIALQQNSKILIRNMEIKQQKKESSEIEIIEERNSKVDNVVVRRYAKKRFLGKGGFAKCYQIEDLESKKISAIKIIQKQTLKKNKAKQKLVTQIKIHKSLSHSNIVGFDHVFQDSENVYMVLQLCSNHTLNEMMKKRKRICELELQYYLYQIINGLIYIHREKVIHRDLKLGNIMINENMEIKIGDFGLAAKLEHPTERRKTICGTPNYLAPEIINNLGHSYEVDIWSLGVIIYTLLYGRPPFETSDIKKTYKRIKECQYTFNEEIHVSNNAKNLISRILIVDPSKRLTLDEIKMHPFMTNNKIPKELPPSALSQPLSRHFIEQYNHYYTSHIVEHSSTKFVPSAKTIQNPKMDKENDLQRAKSEKQISQRLLLRSATGLNRNLFYNKQYQKQENYQAKYTPQLLNNNYFKSDSNARNTAKLSLGGYNPIYIKKWVDYSSKYGLGYLLSDGATGIYFNDSTKMIIDSAGQNVDYINNQCSEGKKLKTFSLASNIQDKEINKKITLMQYFRKYLQGSTSESSKEKKDSPTVVYIKKWFKSDQAIFFRLSNKVIQVNFNDKSQLIFYTEKDIFLYSNSQAKEKLIFQLNSQDIKKYPDICQRLEHSKSMMKNLLKLRPQNEETMKSEAVQVETLYH